MNLCFLSSLDPGALGGGGHVWEMAGISCPDTLSHHQVPFSIVTVCFSVALSLGVDAEIWMCTRSPAEVEGGGTEPYLEGREILL